MSKGPSRGSRRSPWKERIGPSRDVAGRPAPGLGGRAPQENTIVIVCAGDGAATTENEPPDGLGSCDGEVELIV